MNIITKFILALILFFTFQLGIAQEVSVEVTTDSLNVNEIEVLKTQKEAVRNEEKELLKQEVEAINEKVDSGYITMEEGEILKKEIAKKRALNIENRVAIIDNKIDLLARNNEGYTFSDDGQIIIRIGRSFGKDTIEDTSIYIGPRVKPSPKYDKRTTSDLVFAIGFNNALIEDENLGDSPYKLGGSGFVELGWAWKTRVFENSNALRLKYGFSFQWNKLDIKNNMYFREDGDQVVFEEFPFDVKKSKFRTTNLVFPVHFEFGPSKKKEYDDYFRYSTHKKFKFGIGGYGGFNIASLQKVKYYEDGHNQKKKYKDYDAVNSFVYGVSSYVSFGSVGVYFKYDLSPIFRHQQFDQNNISLGLRFDMD
ncbi:conserved hypothetical protein [Formosa agariphila KMM 3901]|uniref:Outer membrane protein beta-barrel domain-containing protein n=1 Tax=Formosa agariphila (strain DSM 15362 / KCTC 12365 / LMG 23005 / KMM 3901 / M-2Alg 35-1) TaxID=1347342 RepID=T2KH19_FORAG|nr:hypothetical protein [Formosa agariphila]CDF78095.1 conserved hypothetical protein [Formosa agariphila KMM 3901]